jgi:hypothetical protein
MCYKQRRRHELMRRDPSSHCRYADIYGALSGSRLWNRFMCHSLFGFNDRMHKFSPWPRAVRSFA